MTAQGAMRRQLSKRLLDGKGRLNRYEEIFKYSYIAVGK